MAFKKNVRPLVIVVISVIGLLVALALVGRQQIFRPKAQVIGALIQTEPTSLNLNPDDTFSIDVSASSMGQQVKQINIDLLFNPQVIQVSDIENTHVLPIEQERELSAQQKVHLNLLNKPDQSREVRGVILRIKGKAVAHGQTELTFTKDTQMLVEGKEGDRLDAVSGTKITVAGSGEAIEQIPIEIQQTYSDNRRVDRALDEFYNSSASESVMPKKSYGIFDSVIEFIHDLNANLEGRAKKALEDKSQKQQ